MVRNVVFDIGNVLVDFRLKEFLASQGFNGDMIKRILKASVLSPYWEQFERCDISEEEALQAFASLDPEIEDDIRRAYANVHGMLTIREYAVSLVKMLKEQGYNVYYLSNYSSKAYKDCADSLEFIPYTDGGLLSFQARMTKPNPDFYKMFLDKFQLNADECVFVDDTEENVIAANQLGFKGIVFKDYDQLMAELEKFGVK